MFSKLFKPVVVLPLTELQIVFFVGTYSITIIELCLDLGDILLSCSIKQARSKRASEIGLDYCGVIIWQWYMTKEEGGSGRDWPIGQYI